VMNSRVRQSAAHLGAPCAPTAGPDSLPGHVATFLSPSRACLYLPVQSRIAGASREQYCDNMDRDPYTLEERTALLLQQSAARGETIMIPGALEPRRRAPRPAEPPSVSETVTTSEGAA
jgi:hypothetical protein